jgi:hypothetical protein
MENPRKFEAADPFGRTWTATLAWLQTAISIRHSDSMDVKWELKADDGTQMERVIALMLPDLLALSKATGHPLTDSWCIRLSSLHLRNMVETWEDSEKVILTPSPNELQGYAQKTVQAIAASR